MSVLERLLARVSDTDLAASIAGDLSQERYRPGRGNGWFFRTALAVLVWLAMDRLGMAARAFVAGARRPGGMSDLTRTVRALARAPWHAIAIAGVMALCIALGTTVLAIVDGVLFKPLELPDADRLWVVESRFRDLPVPDYPNGASVADLDHWTKAAPDVEFTGSRAQPWGGYGSGVNDDAAGVALVLPDFFDVIGVGPMRGGFTPADFDTSPPFQPVLITYDIWQARFGGDDEVIGRRVEIDPTRHIGYRIAGIMPQGFRFPTERTDVEFIGPFVVPPEERGDPRRRSIVEVIAKAPRGMSGDQLRARVEAGMAALAATFPDPGPRPDGWSDRAWRRQGPFDAAAAEPLSQYVGRRSRPLFAAVFAAVSLIVMIAAVNVSGLMAARVLDRAREFAVRRALGATAVALGRLVLLEVLALIAIGAAAGVTVAPLLLRFALTLLPEEIVLLRPAVVDGRVSVLVAAAAAILAIPVSIWPIRRALRANVIDAVGTRTSEPTRTAGRRFVIAVQVAGAFALAVGGALFVGSILSVYANDLPIRTNGVALIECFLQGPGATMQKSAARQARVAALLDRLRQVPGVEAVAATSAQVLRGGNWVSWFTPPPGAPNPRLEVDRQSVTADYYRVLEPRLVAGRLPSDAELATEAPMVVVGERVARAYWHDGNAVGRLLTEQDGAEPYRVVGVVRDVRWYSWDTEVGSIYGPYGRLSREPMVTVLLRTAPHVRSAVVMADAMRAIEALDPTLNAKRAGALDDLFVDSVRERRLQAWLFGSFAAGALVVVGVGIFGLLAMATSRRTKELGIRQALGATRRGVVQLFVREQMTSVCVGLLAGAVLAAWAARFVDAFLYRVSSSDPRVWIVAAVLTLTTAALGVLVPAVRARRTDPVQALRND
jgi:putative ABC transport system permease protein